MLDSILDSNIFTRVLDFPFECLSSLERFPSISIDRATTWKPGLACVPNRVLRHVKLAKVVCIKIELLKAGYTVLLGQRTICCYQGCASYFEDDSFAPVHKTKPRINSRCFMVPFKFSISLNLRVLDLILSEQRGKNVPPS